MHRRQLLVAGGPSARVQVFPDPELKSNMVAWIPGSDQRSHYSYGMMKISWFLICSSFYQVLGWHIDSITSSCSSGAKRKVVWMTPVCDVTDWVAAFDKALLWGPPVACGEIGWHLLKTRWQVLVCDTGRRRQVAIHTHLWPPASEFCRTF